MEKYVLKPTIVVNAAGQSTSQSGGKKRAFPVRMIGEGSHGVISVSNELVPSHLLSKKFFLDFICKMNLWHGLNQKMSVLLYAPINVNLL